ncbi:MAG: glycosyltransferase family 2 protein [Candidatus Melainabacteria bacterium]
MSDRQTETTFNTPVNTPLVSVIMPTYNAAAFIEESVRSVLAQSYPRFELLIADDASTDDTPALVSALNDPRIRYFRLERLGSPARVRNAALREARGEMIAFLDSDDVYLPDALEKLVDALQSHPDWTVAQGFNLVMDETGRPVDMDAALVPDPRGGLHMPDYFRFTEREMVLGHFNCQLPTMMMRRETFDEVGYFNERLYRVEDFEFFLRICRLGLERFGVIPEYIYRYRFYASSATRDPARLQDVVDSSRAVLAWVFSEFQLKPETRALEALAYVKRYRYLAAQQLKAGHAALARKMVNAAFRDPKIPARLCLQELATTALRTLFPAGVNQWLSQWRWSQRHAAAAPGQSLSLAHSGAPL